MSIQKVYNKPVRTVAPLSSVASMKISNEVVEQIRYLHDQVGACEWSGLLMMRIDGTITDIDNLKVDIEGIYPCDIGTTASTSYCMEDHLDDAAEIFPEWDLFADGRWNGNDCTKGTKFGQIHTHHSLAGGAYFSIVDDGDLDENAGTHGLYVSLIVAMDGSYVAKGAFVANTEIVTTLEAKDFKTNFEVVTQEETLVTFKFDLEFETNDWLKDKVDALYAVSMEREEQANNVKMLGTIQNWTKHRKDGVKNFQPLKYHNKLLAESGFDHVNLPGFGNFYQDTLGKVWADDGKEVSEEEQARMGVEFAEEFEN